MRGQQAAVLAVNVIAGKQVQCLADRSKGLNLAPVAFGWLTWNLLFQQGDVEISIS